MATRGSRHLKEEFKDDIVIINASRELDPWEFKAWMVMAAAPKPWLHIEDKHRNTLNETCMMSKVRFRQVLRALVLKGYVETGARSRHKAGTITLRKRPLRLTGEDSIVNPAGGVVGRALAKHEEAKGERVVRVEHVSVTENDASTPSVTEDDASTKKTEPPRGDSPSVTEDDASTPKGPSVTEDDAWAPPLSVTEDDASPKKSDENQDDDPSGVESYASRELCSPSVKSSSKSQSEKTKESKDKKTKRTPTGASTAPGKSKRSKTTPAKETKGAAPAKKSKGPTPEGLKAAKARLAQERREAAAAARAVKEGPVKWDRVEFGGKVSFKLDEVPPEEAEYVRTMIGDTTHPKRAKVLERYSDEVKRQFTNFRNYVKSGYVMDPSPGFTKHAKAFAIGCLCNGLTPVMVFRYWYEEGASWAKIDNPSISLSFMSRATNIEQVIAAGATRGKAKAKEEADAKGKTKIRGHSYDPDDLHPELRTGLEGEGFDLTTGAGVDGDEEWDDNALMSVQRSAETLASGKSLWLPLNMRKMAHWAAENIFGGTTP